MQSQRAQLEALQGGKGQRMTVSRMAELLASRTHTSRPSVTLTRNAKGDTQITVECPADTLVDAASQAMDVYDTLCGRYGRPDA